MPKAKTRKPTAAEERLNALLGLTKKAEEVNTRSIGRFYGITEDELQEFREAQGLIYFLQAPALFTPKTCPHCGEHFLVSRQFVAFCSYTCIRKDLEAKGFRWDKGHDIEELVNDPEVYKGNEPLWIRSSTLKQALKVLTNLLENGPKDLPTQSTMPNSPSSPPTPVSQEKPSITMKPDTDSLPAPSTTTMTGPTDGTTLSPKKRPKRTVTFET
jgi:endogenous inhibitor of DNA gyrase (YacG/DUF329 family)